MSLLLGFAGIVYLVFLQERENDEALMRVGSRILNEDPQAHQGVDDSRGRHFGGFPFDVVSLTSITASSSSSSSVVIAIYHSPYQPRNRQFLPLLGFSKGQLLLKYELWQSLPLLSSFV